LPPPEEPKAYDPSWRSDDPFCEIHTETVNRIAANKTNFFINQFFIDSYKNTDLQCNIKILLYIISV
jgi:hypothetical protein